MNHLKQKFNMLRFRTKLTIILFVVGFVPLALMGVYTITYVHETGIRNREYDMFNYLQQAGTEVEGQTELCAQMMEYLMHNKDVIYFFRCQPGRYEQRIGCYEEIATTIATMKYQNRVMEEIIIYSDSVEEAYGKEIRPLKELEEYAWFGKIGSGENWWYDKEKLQMVSVYRMPVYSGEKSYIMIRSNIIELFRGAEQLAVGKYGIHIVEGGEEIWNFNGEDCIDEKGHLLSFMPDKKEYVWVETLIPNMTVKMIYFYPQQGIGSAALNVFFGIAILILLCFVIIICLGKILSNYISEPLESLTKEIQSMDVRVMHTTVTTNREDEIGILITSHRNMVRKIQELIRENYETKLAQREFELKALQAQINPHFLYNSLSVINWKAFEAGQKEIREIVLLLSSFYRTTLNKGKSMNTIRNALENIKAYLSIQLIMHDGNFQVFYDIDENVYDYQIPLLIFQPIVENALEHGLDTKENPDHRLWITVSQGESVVYIIVSDNGVGMTQDKVSRVLEYDTEGYGVKNVNDRMKLIYGEDYHIQIESEIGIGTQVLLKFPKLKDKN